MVGAVFDWNAPKKDWPIIIANVPGIVFAIVTAVVQLQKNRLLPFKGTRRFLVSVELVVANQPFAPFVKQDQGQRDAQ